MTPPSAVKDLEIVFPFLPLFTTPVKGAEIHVTFPWGANCVGKEGGLAEEASFHPYGGPTQKCSKCETPDVREGWENFGQLDKGSLCTVTLSSKGEEETSRSGRGGKRKANGFGLREGTKLDLARKRGLVVSPATEKKAVLSSRYFGPKIGRAV